MRDRKVRQNGPFRTLAQIHFLTRQIQEKKIKKRLNSNSQSNPINDAIIGGEGP
jgi:hypothetical protein